jgi:SAM-dependent methyltransferase
MDRDTTLHSHHDKAEGSCQPGDALSLVLARPLDGFLLPEPVGRPPFALADLAEFRGRHFWLPPGDPALEGLFEGEPAPSPAFENLAGATRAWLDDPEVMDFLDPQSPACFAKACERDLYLALAWGPYFESPGRVLDAGGGIGRFTLPLLRAGAHVDLVDPDLRSLWAAVSHAAELPAQFPGSSEDLGRLDVHWSTTEKIGELDLGIFDLCVAAELLCYVESPVASIEQIRRSLKPGGFLLCSVEARRGWAAAADVTEGSLDALFSDGVVHVPGDRHVVTFEEDELRSLLVGFEILTLLPTHYTVGGPFAAAAGQAPLDTLMDWERRCRESAVLRPFNRAWTVVAQRSA